MKLAPYKFQAEDVEGIHARDGNCLLASEMGLGKTPLVLWYAQKYLKQWPVIVVCPASLKYNWQREITKFLGMISVVLESRLPSQKLPKASFYLVNYEILGAWLPRLLKLKAGLVVFDEAHRIQNRSAKCTKAARQLAKDIPKRIGVSGTPLTNRPAELWSILNIIRPDLYPSLFSFAMEYSIPEKVFGRWQYTGARNLDKLHKELKATVMIRRLKKDVLKDLPPKVRSVVSMPVKNRKEYDSAVKDFVSWLGKNRKRIQKSRKIRSIWMGKLTVLKRLAGLIKFDSVVEWIENFLAESNEKLIVFGIHRTMLHALHERWKKTSVLVDGSVTGKNRQAKFDRFNDDFRTRLCFGNIHACGVGWSAKGKKRPINTVAFCELDWRPASMTQAEDRCYGLERGLKDRGAQIFYLVAKDTVEQKLLEIIERKQGVLNQVLDGEEAVDSLDVFTQFQNSLLEERRYGQVPKNSLLPKNPKGLARRV